MTIDEQVMTVTATRRMKGHFRSCPPREQLVSAWVQTLVLFADYRGKAELLAVNLGGLIRAERPVHPHHLPRPPR
jgi:hypothetical protein